MKPSEMLDLQGDLFGRVSNINNLLNRHMVEAMTIQWQTNPYVVLDTFTQRHEEMTVVPHSILDQIEKSRKERGLDEKARELGINATACFSEVVQNATCYHVSDEMTKLIVAASRSLNEEDTFDSSLIPSEDGMAYFEGGLPVRDVRGRLALIHILVWSKTQRGAVFYAFNDFHYPDDISREMLADPLVNTEEFKRDVGRWSFLHCNPIDDDDEIGPEVTKLGFFQSLKLVEEGSTPTDCTRVSRYYHSFFLMMSQKITAVEAPHVDRPATKRAARRGSPGTVKVMRLRKTERPDYDSSEAHSAPVDWSCRWVVDSHWAWRACGPGRKERRRVLIMPYVKGPNGAPLRVKKTVIAVHR